LDVIRKRKHGNIVGEFATARNFIRSCLRRISVKKDRFEAAFERVHIGVEVQRFRRRDDRIVIAESLGCAYGSFTFMISTYQVTFSERLTDKFYLFRVWLGRAAFSSYSYLGS
jgi:hypothetical protein